MYLITSWRESCAMLKPSNIKLLLLVSIKGSIHTYALLLKYWWWLFVSIAVADILLVGQLLVEPAAVFYYASIWWLYIYFVFKALLWLVICLCARSSIKNKNMNYFLTYISRFFVAALLGCLLIFCLLGLLAAWVLSFWRLEPTTISLLGISYLLAYCIVIWNFFLLDGFGIKAFRNAVYMVVLNLPFMVVSFILFNIFIQMTKILLIYLVQPLPWSIQLVVSDALLLVLYVVLINIISTFYIKRVHDQFPVFG